MSSLTSKEVRDLMEAYQQVYAPQEISEEQVWEEVEDWVNGLLDEGYDLSDYTWEEMYEAYIEEQGGRNRSTTTGAVTMYAQPRANTGQSYQSPYARPRQDKLNSLNTGGRRPQMPGLPSNYRGQELQAARKAAYSQIGTGRSNAGTGAPPAPSSTRATTTTSTGTTAAPAGTTAAPAAGSTKPAGTPARAFSPANASTADKIKGGMEVYNKQKQSGDVKGAAQTGMDVNKLKYGDNFAKPKTPNPLMKGMPGQNKAELDQIRGNAALSSISQSPSANRILSGTARSQTANEIGKASLDRSAASISAKPAPTPAAKPEPTTPPKKPETQLFHTDLFDLVKGYLLDEGYADTEEAALAIMSSMSEEWRESIVQNYLDEQVPIGSKNYGDTTSDKWNKGYSSYMKSHKAGREMTPPAIPKGYKYSEKAGTVVRNSPSQTVAKPSR